MAKKPKGVALEGHQGGPAGGSVGSRTIKKRKGKMEGEERAAWKKKKNGKGTGRSEGVGSVVNLKEGRKFPNRKWRAEGTPKRREAANKGGGFSRAGKVNTPSKEYGKEGVFELKERGEVSLEVALGG